jgi:hypothetical protein
MRWNMSNYTAPLRPPKPNEFFLRLNDAEDATIPEIENQIMTGTTCTTSCITGLGGEDIVYTCVGV